MTRQEAEAFMERNPRIKKQLADFDPELLAKLDLMYIGGIASNEADGKVNLVRVLEALADQKSTKK